MSHTPTPWFVTSSSMGVHHYIESRIRPGTLQEVASCGPTEGDEGSEGNAAFIVRAVNAHDALAEYFHASESLQMTIGHPEASEGDEAEAENRFRFATVAARDALAAKAEAA